MEHKSYVDALKATKKHHEAEIERLNKMIAVEEGMEMPTEEVVEETEKKFAYTFTDDEKKVMKGLECCSNPDGGTYGCDECPYDKGVDCRTKNAYAIQLINKLAGLYEVLMRDINDLSNRYIRIREEADTVHADRDEALQHIQHLREDVEALKERNGALENEKLGLQVKLARKTFTEVLRFFKEGYDAGRRSVADEIGKRCKEISQVEEDKNAST